MFLLASFAPHRQRPVPVIGFLSGGAVIAPQARTDPMPAPANYSDRVLEVEAALPILRMTDRLLQYRRSGAPLETNALVDHTRDTEGIGLRS